MAKSEVHVISENDLQGVKRIGGRLRALCPIHNSRDRDLSIAPYFVGMDEEQERLAGWGHCHSINCGVTVLVREWNPRAASYYLGGYVAPVEPKITVLADAMLQASEWQIKQLAALKKIHASATGMLQHARALAYLKQRGIAHMLDTLLALEAGYIPPADEWRAAVPAELAVWCDRIIYPYTCANGDIGYIGRTLQLWTPGMDENEHKDLLKKHEARMEQIHGADAGKYQIIRWRKTYKSGLFNAACMKEHHEINLCEGPFDAVPLIHEGLKNTIALAGTHVDASDYPKSVYEVTLAYDADVDETSKKHLAIIEALGRAGIAYTVKKPAQDDKGKDWSERYRLYGRAGLYPLISEPAQDEPVVVISEPIEPAYACADCATAIEADDRDFFFTDEGICYCTICRDPSTCAPRQVDAPAPARELSLDEIMDKLTAAVPGQAEIIDKSDMYTLPVYILPAQLAATEQEQQTQAVDYWFAALRTRLKHTPTDSRGVPYYRSRADWLKRYEQDLQWRPDPGVFWYKIGYEQYPIPKNYQHTYSEPMPPAQEIAQARATLQQSQAITPQSASVYSAWLDSAAPNLVLRGINAVRSAAHV